MASLTLVSWHGDHLAFYWLILKNDPRDRELYPYIGRHLKMVDKFERGRDGKELDLERSRKICHFQNLLTLPLILRKLARKSFYCRGLHVYAILCTLVRPTRIPQVPSSGNEELLFATLHTILCVPLSLIIPYLVGRSYT